MNELTHYLNGAHVAGTSGRHADVMNPATGEVQARVPLASTEELNRAVEIAAAAQPAWAATNPQRRARVMMKFVALLQRADAELHNFEAPLDVALGIGQRGLGKLVHVAL
ncbi:MAG: aldehyde dehydrogenase family protein, partial [Pseudomonadota bacterium]